MAHDDDRARWIERALVLALLVGACFLRARDLREPFDREFEGAQGAFFALGCVNYERLGAGTTGGYPVVNVDLGVRGGEGDLRRAPQAWYVYANHPPLVPLLAWSAIRAGRGAHWADEADAGRAPPGIEPWIRAPFLALHLAGLFTLWWAVKSAAGSRRALIALAVASVLPIGVLYGTLVNYENPSLVAVLAAAGFTARWLRGGRTRDLVRAACAFALGGAVSYAAACFVAPLALVVLARAGWRRAGAYALLAGLAAAVPLALHGLWSARSLARLGLSAEPVLARARALWAPLLDGSRPPSEWLGLQFERLGPWFTWPIAFAAGLGLATACLSACARRGARDPVASDPGRPLDLEPALLAGGALYLFAFYRHTLDPQHPFLLLLAPGIAGLAALALERFPRPFANARVAAALAGLAVVGVLQAEALRRDFRGAPHEDGSAQALAIPDATGAELATLVPAGGFGIHPACVGLNVAASFYAWRSLWPAQGPGDTLPRAVARAFGLGAARHVLLLPKEPWAGVAEEVGAFEREWVKSAPPDRESERWRAWDLH